MRLEEGASGPVQVSLENAHRYIQQALRLALPLSDRLGHVLLEKFLVHPIPFTKLLSFLGGCDRIRGSPLLRENLRTHPLVPPGWFDVDRGIRVPKGFVEIVSALEHPVCRSIVRPPRFIDGL